MQRRWRGNRIGEESVRGSGDEVGEGNWREEVVGGVEEEGEV